MGRSEPVGSGARDDGEVSDRRHDGVAGTGCDVPSRPGRKPGEQDQAESDESGEQS